MDLLRRLYFSSPWMENSACHIVRPGRKITQWIFPLQGTDSWISSRLFSVIGVWLQLGLLGLGLGVRLVLVLLGLQLGWGWKIVPVMYICPSQMEK